MDGVLLIDKPKGLTSTRVVEKVKKKLKLKVGHTGALDPVATGLLILLTGKATRFSWLFLNMEKTYRVTGLLGVITDTYDITGNVEEEREVNVSCEDIKKVLEDFKGEIEQTPPPYSAKKVGGVRAYELARKGIRVQLKPVKVSIYEIELKRCEIPEFEIVARVSSGTYMRTLIHDIGQKLSCGATMKDLTRLKVGDFSLDDAVSLEEFMKSENPKSFIIPIEKALEFLPKISLDYFYGKRILNGNPVLIGDYDKEGYVRIYIDEQFIGVGSIKSGILKPERLIPVQSKSAFT